MKHRIQIKRRPKRWWTFRPNLNESDKLLRINHFLGSHNRTERKQFLIETCCVPKACFTSALRQPCTYLRRRIFWFRTAASRCTKNKVARLPQRIFDMFIFFAICLHFLRDVRQPQDTQGCRKTAARHAGCSYD